MILTDAGPLIALLDKGESAHKRCVAALSMLRHPMLTTWPAFTEATYLLGDAGGWPAQERLWRLYLRGDLQILMPERVERAAALMQQYKDLPMDLADATLVALAEERQLTTIFTLDKDFHVYKLGRNKHFKVIPE